MFSRDAVDTHFLVFGLTRPGFKLLFDPTWVQTLVWPDQGSNSSSTETLMYNDNCKVMAT
jgi:hypothetical protein